MHLCFNCQPVDWGERLRQHQAVEKNGGGIKSYCPYCTHVGGARVLLPLPSLAMCDHCAMKRDECQSCGASTLTSRQQASCEAFEALFDGYVTLVKTYGASVARGLLIARRDGTFEGDQRLSVFEAEHVDALVSLDVGAVDSMQPHQPYHYRLKRAIWTKVWGQLGYSACPPRCPDCAAPPRHSPAMTRAAECGHWTAGSAAARCLPCAVEARACAHCSASTQ